MSEDKKSKIGFVAIVLLMIGILFYGISVVETEYVNGHMSEECKKIWLEQGEEVAVKNGC